MITIAKIQNQSSSDWTFENVQYKEHTLQYVRVSYTGEKYTLINFSRESIPTEIESRLLTIAESFHKANIWSVVNMTAA